MSETGDLTGGELGHTRIVGVLVKLWMGSTPPPRQVSEPVGQL